MGYTADIVDEPIEKLIRSGEDLSASFPFFLFFTTVSFARTFLQRFFHSIHFVLPSNGVECDRKA